MDTLTIPFVRGSDTSEAAAGAKGGSADSDREKVRRFIASRAADGATDDEIELALGMRHQNASARRNGLVRDGLVMDSGKRRKTRSGRRAVVWIAGRGFPVEGAPNNRLSRPSDELLRRAAMVLEVAGVGEVADWLRHITQ